MLLLRVEAGAGVFGHIVAETDAEETRDLRLWRSLRDDLTRLHERVQLDPSEAGERPSET